MFTGIILGAGRVVRSQSIPAGRRLEVELPESPTSNPARPSDRAAGGGEDPWARLEIGESIAVSGVCLTLVAATERTVSFDVIQETLRRTSLGAMKTGSRVNLERALRVGDRLGGHYVTGHVDGSGRVDRWQRSSAETKLFIGVDPESRSTFRTIPKGSVALDGVSLTVVDSSPTGFSVALIPHTLKWTSLGELRVGDRVNLEMDTIGKWVEALIVPR